MTIHKPKSQWRPFKIAKIAAPSLMVLVFGWLGVRMLTDSSAATVPGGTATLTVTASSPTVVQGQQVSFTVRANSPTETFNAVRADLTYPTNLLQIVGTSTSCTDPPFAVTAENIQTTPGMATLACGSMSGLTGNQTVATFTFTALAATGTANVTVANTSEILRNSDSSNILGTITGASVNIVAQTPTITTITPGSGTTAGGTTVTIAGTNFSGTPTVMFASKPATSVTVTSGTSLTAVAPSATTPGAVNVSVTVGGQTATKTNGYTYTDTVAPTVPGTPTVTTNDTGKVVLSWTASTDTGGSGLAGYRVYRNGTLLNTSALATSATYTDTTVAPKTAYSYTVAAVDGSGNASAQSAGVSVTSRLVGDVNSDGFVNLTDLSRLLSFWNTNNASADLNKDGTVTLTDLSMLLSNWGK